MSEHEDTGLLLEQDEEEVDKTPYYIRFPYVIGKSDILFIIFSMAIFICIYVYLSYVMSKIGVIEDLTYVFDMKNFHREYELSMPLPTHSNSSKMLVYGYLRRTVIIDDMVYQMWFYKRISNDTKNLQKNASYDSLEVTFPAGSDTSDIFEIQIDIDEKNENSRFVLTLQSGFMGMSSITFLINEKNENPFMFTVSLRVVFPLAIAISAFYSFFKTDRRYLSKRDVNTLIFVVLFSLLASNILFITKFQDMSRIYHIIYVSSTHLAFMMYRLYCFYLLKLPEDLKSHFLLIFGILVNVSHEIYEICIFISRGTSAINYFPFYSDSLSNFEPHCLITDVISSFVLVICGIHALYATRTEDVFKLHMRLFISTAPLISSIFRLIVYANNQFYNNFIMGIIQHTVLFMFVILISLLRENPDNNLD